MNGGSAKTKRETETSRVCLPPHRVPARGGPDPLPEAGKRRRAHRQRSRKRVAAPRVVHRNRHAPRARQGGGLPQPRGVGAVLFGLDEGQDSPDAMLLADEGLGEGGAGQRRTKMICCW